MKAPKVSVIIPNYNHAKFLKRRIDSVIHQTYRDFEVIILDDYSSDNSREIIELYRPTSVIKEIIFNDQNSGSPFLQWRRGLELAEGEWVWFAETDDFAELNFLDTLLKEVKDKNSIGLIYSDSRLMGNNGNIDSRTFADLKNQIFNTNRWSKNYINNGIEELQNFVLLASTINNSSAVLFKRDLLVKTNPFDMPLRFMGDRYAFVKILAISDILYVNQPLNYYRIDLNERNESKATFYFDEHFRIFDYAVRNIKFKDKKKVNKAILRFTRDSLIRRWNFNKIKIYFSLFKLNPKFMLRCLLYNMFAPFYLHILPKKSNE